MIQMNDFKTEPEELVRQQIAAVERVLRSGWYILGNEVKEFEAKWADACAAKHCVGVGNGMDAIEIGLRCLGIGPGDEVITTPMTAFATVLAVIRAGGVPVLADIDPATALLDPTSVERCITSRTKAVLLVHLYGQMRNMERWAALCKQANILLLEDCAQSHLALWNGKAGGTFGAWGAYSFYPTKNLGAIGDGGALITDMEQVAAQAKVLRNYGQSERYHHPELGLNSRLDELQAAILRVRLNWLDSFTKRRKEIGEAYYSGIHNPRVHTLARPENADSHVHHLFVVCSAERDRLASHLKERGVGTLIHYPVPVHHQKPCAGIRKDLQGLKHAEKHAAECLSIPCHPQMSDTDVRTVIEAVNAFR